MQQTICPSWPTLSIPKQQQAKITSCYLLPNLYVWSKKKNAVVCFLRGPVAQFVVHIAINPRKTLNRDLNAVRYRADRVPSGVTQEVDSNYWCECAVWRTLVGASLNVSTLKIHVRQYLQRIRCNSLKVWRWIYAFSARCRFSVNMYTSVVISLERKIFGIWT